jgi:hypothetical protein
VDRVDAVTGDEPGRTDKAECRCEAQAVSVNNLDVPSLGLSSKRSSPVGEGSPRQFGQIESLNAVGQVEIAGPARDGDLMTECAPAVGEVGHDPLHAAAAPVGDGQQGRRAVTRTMFPRPRGDGERLNLGQREHC